MIFFFVDKLLENEKSLYDLHEKHKKKGKAYQLLLLEHEKLNELHVSRPKRKSMPPVSYKYLA